MINKKISFCTVCMNRLHHLMETLPTNIIDNVDYDNLEFVLLDYNSSDGLEEYVRKNWNAYLASKRLVYFKTKTPQFFNRSHSRNLAFKVSSGDIICNIDADNYVGKGFAKYINHVFSSNTSIFMGASGQTDVLGRICVRKDDFYLIKGYDELMSSYGFEDIDLVNRLRILGLQKIEINSKYLNTVNHSVKDRILNESTYNKLQALYVHYINPTSSELLFLFEDCFRIGTLINNQNHDYSTKVSKRVKLQLKYQHSILEEVWQTGSWLGSESKIYLYHQDQRREVLNCSTDENCLVNFSLNKKYYHILDDDMIEEAIMFYSQLSNRIIMENNKYENRYEVNPNGYGRDLIYKNFQNHSPIECK